MQDIQDNQESISDGGSLPSVSSATRKASRAAADRGFIGGVVVTASLGRSGEGEVVFFTINSLTSSPRDRAASSTSVAASRNRACQTGLSTK